VGAAAALGTFPPGRGRGAKGGAVEAGCSGLCYVMYRFTRKCCPYPPYAPPTAPSFVEYSGAQGAVPGSRAPWPGPQGRGGTGKPSVPCRGGSAWRKPQHIRVPVRPAFTPRCASALLQIEQLQSGSRNGGCMPGPEVRGTGVCEKVFPVGSEP
jgi:hypothetical protein